ncbi:MAG: PolC-type DNA polymerase III [Lachnospiraceae bacterium]|nr:PolC-type DNA polymerase III [Lachnospiraceae bacterium]
MGSEKFFDAFPDLKLKDGLKNLFDMTEIEKIFMNKENQTLTIKLLSPRLIEKKQLNYVAYEIKKQLLSNTGLFVKIEPYFKLSSQYNPENLYDAYKESIYEELLEESRLLANLFQSAEMEFLGENMKIILTEYDVIDYKVKQLVTVLKEIFEVRCGIKVDISVEYKQLEQDIDAKFDIDDVYSVPIIQKKPVEKKETKEVAAEEKKPEEKKAEEKPAEKKNFKDNKFFKREKTETREENPDVIYGRSFSDENLDISEINDETGEVAIRGEIVSVDIRAIRNEKSIISFIITDYTDSIKSKIFVKNEELQEYLNDIDKGKFIRLKGVAIFDNFEREVCINSVTGIMKSKDFRVFREDRNEEKRVELHCHTTMSDMDGLASAGSLINQAIRFGHKALAITDHGCVQGFTEALHAIDKIKGKYKAKGEELDFKIIYGVEAYLVDDLKDIVINSKGQNLDDTYVVFDLETTGFSATYDKIIEIGAVKIKNGEIVDRFSTFVNPQIPIPYHIEEVTSINDSMVVNADTIDVVLPKFLEFCEGCIMVAHNAEFDMSYIIKNSRDLGVEREYTVVDTVYLARFLLPSMARYKLDNVAKALGIVLKNHHRAVEDAECTAEIFVKFIEMLKGMDIHDLDKLNESCKPTPDLIKKLPSHHAIILAKNEIGRINLYRLVSMSHIDYFYRNPRIPKSEYLKYCEGLIIGSACEAGELFQAVYGGKDDAEIARLVNFYDYLEIQPIGNNMFMVDKEETTVENLIDVNKRIVKLGEKFNKPVVATCDVHFLNPEDSIYRAIIMAGKGFPDADKQAPLYLRTTDEMLEEFSYLGKDKAREVVITNTNLINDMIENISPVHPDKAAPVIPNSDQTLRDICYNKAHSMYGEELPPVVVERLERELKSIISNGFAVMYIIAQKLVWKSNEDGYLVGSRGSVGSSFVATMAGITEVNPLSPHYYCKKCHYSDFDSEEVKQYSGGAGCDMPDKNCPNCGEPLVKDGFDIPFETFLGFKGNKEPDIDLNFSGEYQAKAHEYTEVIFGKGQTFRAGTIGTMADKTAFVYVKKYFEERNIVKRTCEMERLALGCVGVRRTTGQHPGGIIVLPYGQEIYKFTPVQRPANDMTTKTVTTHFDYHSIDHNLLKLDILGHDDPTMIRMLEDLTGLDAKTIPFDDQKVMSLFKSTEALGIDPKDIDGCPLGSLGIPEFGTDFVIQMLIDTKPKQISDLIRISGLSHGTDVWLGNAQTLIQEGKATISTAICTRDDIMTYLIHMGMDSELSFTIMESVRKGKGLKPEWETEMLAHNVPDWYIWSCKKIQYMFPKAHAAAYVMMAFRIAYFKVFYPLAYYTAFFSIRASAFDYEIMCQGKERIDAYIKNIKAQIDRGENKPKDVDVLKDAKIVQEMYARGFSFMPIDIYKAHATRFQIIDGKIMPSLGSIEGMGDKAAEAVMEAAKDGPFLSKEDFRNRTKVSKTVIDTMSDLGLFGNLTESNQMSFIDFM